MKTRIRIVEYDDGRKEYFPEVRRNFKTHFISMFENDKLLVLFLFALAILIALICSLLWEKIEHPELDNNGVVKHVSKCIDVKTAKESVDDYISSANKQKSERGVAKLSKKKVKTEFLDYP